MPLTLSANLRAATQKMHTTQEWAWLLELEADVQTLARTLFRLTDAPEQLSLDMGGGQTKVFYPFPMAFGSLEDDSQGNVHSLTVSLSNVTQELIPYLFKGDGFMQRNAVLYIAHRSSMTVTDCIQRKYKVTSAGADLSVVTMTMKAPINWEREIPQEQLGRHCSAIYQGEVCAYRGPLASCLFTYADCVAHGDEEVSRGYPRQHPARFDGFPALSMRVA